MFRCFTKDQDDQMNRCLDVFTTKQVRCFAQSIDCSKLPDEQMFRCFYHKASKMFCSKHMTVKTLQMNRCLDVSSKIKMIKWIDVFTTEEKRCFAQSIWLFKTCRWTDVWMFHQIFNGIFTQITWLFKKYI